MQNRNCQTADAAYVTLNGSWTCGGCGCVNQCGSSCVRCGWSGCGCWGGVVRTGGCTRRTRNNGCCAETAEETGCTRRTRNSDCCAETAEETGCTRRTRNSDCCAETAEETGCTRRARNSGCCAETAEETGCTRRTRNSGCCTDEAEEASQGRSKSSANDGVGMVYAVEQELERMHGAGFALRSGTLYPELHKPMNGYSPCQNGCTDEERELAFALWELRLYLNTHPDDCQAMTLFQKLRARAEELNYATAFIDCDTDSWNWTDDPWPWENRKCRG